MAWRACPLHPRKNWCRRHVHPIRAQHNFRLYPLGKGSPNRSKWPSRRPWLKLEMEPIWLEDRIPWRFDRIPHLQRKFIAPAHWTTHKSSASRLFARFDTQKLSFASFTRLRSTLAPNRRDRTPRSKLRRPARQTQKSNSRWPSGALRAARNRIYPASRFDSFAVSLSQTQTRTCGLKDSIVYTPGLICGPARFESDSKLRSRRTTEFRRRDRTKTAQYRLWPEPI